MTNVDSISASHWRLKAGLTVVGFVAGAAFGLALTWFGKIIAGAPPGTLANYTWNAAAFGALAGVVNPTVAWSELRRVPLWRTVVEPLALAVGGGAVAVLVGVPALLLILPPAGLIAGFVHLERRYRKPAARLQSPMEHE